MCARSSGELGRLQRRLRTAYEIGSSPLWGTTPLAERRPFTEEPREEPHEEPRGLPACAQQRILKVAIPPGIMHMKPAFLAVALLILVAAPCRAEVLGTGTITPGIDFPEIYEHRFQPVRRAYRGKVRGRLPRLDERRRDPDGGRGLGQRLHHRQPAAEQRHRRQVLHRPPVPARRRGTLHAGTLVLRPGRPGYAATKEVQ